MQKNREESIDHTLFYCASKSWPESWPTSSAALRNN